MLEYFISTHGARKGLADTALRTADSGYLTRRLRRRAGRHHAATTTAAPRRASGSATPARPSRRDTDACSERIDRPLVGRSAVADGRPGRRARVDRRAQRGDHRREIARRARRSAASSEVYVRSPLTCEAATASAALCYGRTWRRGELVGIGEAVGIIAAQSIGEPGTQLTMRTFHTGGVARPVRHHDRSAARRGAVRGPRAQGQGDPRRDRRRRRDHPRRRRRAASRSSQQRVYTRRATTCPKGYELLVNDGEQVELGQVARPRSTARTDVPSRRSSRGCPGRDDRRRQLVDPLPRSARSASTPCPHRPLLGVEDGEHVHAGDAADRRAEDPQDPARSGAARRSSATWSTKSRRSTAPRA